MSDLTLATAVDDFMTYQIGGNRSPKTIEFYRYMLGKFVERFGADCPIESITLDQLRKWRADLKTHGTMYDHHQYREPINKPISPFTLHAYVRSTRILFKWLFDDGKIAVNVAERFELPKLPRDAYKGMSVANMTRMIEAARDSVRDYAIVLFLADTCCRVGGLISLRLSVLDLASGRAIVREKGSEERTVYMVPETVKAMQAWLNVRPCVDHDYVFVSATTHGHHGAPMTVSGINQIMEKLATKAGVEGRVSPHQWRHGGARAMLQNGAPLSVVADVLGHADAGTTFRFYSSLGTEQLKRQHNKYSWRNEAGHDHIYD